MTRIGADASLSAHGSLPTIHQHRLAYLLGLEGVALMRAFAGEHDRDFVAARLDEVRKLLDRADELGDGQLIEPLDAAVAYDAWAPRYDTPDNPFFTMDEAVLLRSSTASRPV